MSSCGSRVDAKWRPPRIGLETISRERPVRGPDTGYTEVGARVGRCDLIGLTEAFVYSRPFQS